jgi:ribosomal protein L21
MYAVIQTGGKQYRVAPGDTIRIERVKGDVGEQVKFGTVLAVHTDDKKVMAGSDASKASVTGEEAHRSEVQEDQPVQDSAGPPAELHGRAGQRDQAVNHREELSHGT